MNHLTKEEKYILVKDLSKKHQITAYEIAKNTNLSEAGVLNIITGKSKRPHESTIDEILNFFDERIIGSKIPGTKNYLKNKIVHNLIEEEKQKYDLEKEKNELFLKIYLKLEKIEQSFDNDISVIADGVKKTYLNTNKILTEGRITNKSIQSLELALKK